MRHPILFAAVAAAFLALASVSHAAGWSFTADAPLSYTFDKGAVNKLLNPAGAQGNWSSKTSTDVSGSKVMLIAPFHIGVGYEDYTVNQTFTAGPPCTVVCAGHAHLNIQMVDVMIDIPTRFLNIGLGFGQGQASLEALAPPNGTPNLARHADAQQAFLVLGIPLGTRWDLHVGYHWVTVQEKDIKFAGQNPPYDKLQGSGTMLSAGARLNF
jgi:hypothetical protein